tara:strand:- start:368 stop:478 length:111 start_codon:yes stop_codon:yes gene_type:complete
VFTSGKKKGGGGEAPGRILKPLMNLINPKKGADPIR